MSELRRTVSVRVSGARTFRFDGPLKTTVTVRRGVDGSAEQAVAGITLGEPLVDGRHLGSTEVVLVGVYRGDGTYPMRAGLGRPVPTVGPTAGPVAATDPDFATAIAFTIFDKADPKIQERFAHLLEPCEVVFAKDVTEGSAKCPALASIGGNKISFEMSWRA